MRTSNRIGLVVGIMVAGLGLVPAEAQAYIGPGAGLAAIGTLIAIIAAIFFTIVGFVWYPLKRLFRMLGIMNAKSQGGEKASSS